MEYELIEAGDDRCALAPRRDGGVPQDMSLDKPDRPFIEPHGSHWPRRDAPAMTQMGEE